MPTISWNENSPADIDSAGLGDDEIRSLKTSIRVGLDGEHVWPSAGGDAGVHRLGSARPYFGAQSLVSSTGSDGRLFQTSDTSRLFGVGSGGTSFIGGATVISAGGFPGSVPQRHYWAMEFGQADTGLISGSVTSAIVSIPNSGYSGIPFITATIVDSSATRQFLRAQSVSATQFTVVIEPVGLGVRFNWMSLGTRVF